MIDFATRLRMARHKKKREIIVENGLPALKWQLDGEGMTTVLEYEGYGTVTIGVIMNGGE